MKTNHSYISLLCFVLIIHTASAQAHKVAPCTPSQYKENHTRSAQLEEAMEKLVNKGIPGASMALFSDEGWWYTAKGYSRIEDRSPLQICHLQYLQSIAKTYHAVAILKLYEDGQIDLERAITTYLPQDIASAITDAEKITVKMLLNHTSGIREYNFNPNYVTKLLQQPDYEFTGRDYVAYIKKKPLDFEPGSRYAYRNSNYVILALILDEITGNHAQYIDDVIFKRLGLSRTFYRNDANFLNYPELVNSYWDRNGTGIVENATNLQRKNVAHMVGDDGIVTTPIEAVKFLKGLLEGALLEKKTVELMKEWVTRDTGEYAYGLGLSHTEIAGMAAYGHSGGGIGAGCELYYVPEKNLYYFIAVNMGTLTDSPILDGIAEIRSEIYEILLR